jgi:hypothetical protein
MKRRRGKEKEEIRKRRQDKRETERKKGRKKEGSKEEGRKEEGRKEGRKKIKEGRKKEKEITFTLKRPCLRCQEIQSILPWKLLFNFSPFTLRVQ